MVELNSAMFRVKNDLVYDREIIENLLLRMSHNDHLKMSEIFIFRQLELLARVPSANFALDIVEQAFDSLFIQADITMLLNTSLRFRGDNCQSDDITLFELTS